MFVRNVFSLVTFSNHLFQRFSFFTSLLQSMLLLASKLSEKTINNQLLKYFAKLQMDQEVGMKSMNLPVLFSRISQFWLMSLEMWKIERPLNLLIFLPAWHQNKHHSLSGKNCSAPPTSCMYSRFQFDKCILAYKFPSARTFWVCSCHITY